MSKHRTVRMAGGLPGTLKLALCGGAPKLHLYVDGMHRELGHIYRDRLGDVEGVFLSEPRAARRVFSAEGSRPKHIIPPPWSLYNRLYSCKRGLFFMDGDEWFKYRQIMNPIFLKKNLTASLEDVYDDITETFLNNCSMYEEKEIPNLEHLLYKHSISFTIGHLLGASYINNKDLFQEDIEHLSSITNAIFSSTAKLMNLPVNLVAKLRLPAWKNFVHAVDSSLLASRKLTEKILKLELCDGMLKDMMKQNLNVSILQALILDLMLAAGDTTAFTTQWALYFLSEKREAVEKLREDSSSVRGILRETLRLYPAAMFLSRYLQEDLHVLEYIIPKGELVMISLYTMGRLENVYPEAECFKPERWSRGVDGHLAGVNEPMAYFPFALGARSCIGRKLAEAQIYHTLTKIEDSRHKHSERHGGAWEWPHLGPVVTMVVRLNKADFQIKESRGRQIIFFSLHCHLVVACGTISATPAFFSKYDLELQEKVDMELQLVPVPRKPIRFLLKRRS